MPTKRSCMLSVKLRPREKARLRAVAAAKDVTLAELVRSSLAAMILQDLAVELSAPEQPIKAGHA